MTGVLWVTVGVTVISCRVTVVLPDRHPKNPYLTGLVTVVTAFSGHCRDALIRLESVNLLCISPTLPFATDVHSVPVTLRPSASDKSEGRENVVRNDKPFVYRVNRQARTERAMHARRAVAERRK
jgi:hypothetical protein